MEIKRINPVSLHRGVPYDYAVVAPAGGVVFTAGACPLDSDGEIVAPGDLEAQAGKCQDNLEAVLTEAGSGFPTSA
jgi:enamine deaminase RidA (YjgF/YER057c/UK114 family)